MAECCKVWLILNLIINLHIHRYDFASLQAYVLANIPDDCIIIAQSMGGIFAVAAALQYPEKVKGLVLVATSGGMDLSSFQVQDWRQDYQASDLNYPDWFVGGKGRLHGRLC